MEMSLVEMVQVGVVAILILGLLLVVVLE